MRRIRLTIGVLALTFSSQTPVLAQKAPSEWLKKAQQDYYKGDYQGAYDACNVVIEAEPNNVEAWTLRGDTNLPWALGGAVRGVLDYDFVLKLSPANYHALTYRGLVRSPNDPVLSKQDLLLAIKVLKSIKSRNADQERFLATATFWHDLRSSLSVVERFAETNPTDSQAQFLLACALEGNGRYEEAHVAFRKVLEFQKKTFQNHCTGDDLRQFGRACLSLRMPDYAIETLSAYLKTHPNNLHALYWRGYFLNHLRQPKEAVTDFAKSVELGPTYLNHLRSLADVQFGLKQYREAARTYRRMLDREPRNQILMCKRAQCLKSLNMTAIAIQDLNKYLEKYPASFLVLQAKASLERKDNPDQAHQDLKRALTLLTQSIQGQPGIHQRYAIRCNLYQDFGQPQKAMEDINEALRLKPDEAAYHNTRSCLNWNQLNRKEEAIADEIRAVDYAPEYSKTAYLTILSRYYLELERFDKALECANRCITLQPQMPDGYSSRVAVSMAMGRPEKALADLEQIKQLKIPLTDTDYLCGKAYLSLNKPKEALTAFDTSLKKHPDDLITLLARGELYAKQEKYELALGDCNRAAELYPENGDVYFARHRVYTSLGQYLKAANDLTKGMQINKTTNAPWVLVDRARIYTYAERYKEAASDMEKAYCYSPDKPLYMYQCGKLLYWSGNKLAAIDAITAYLNRVTDPLALRARARCYFETDQLDKSIADYTTLIEQERDNPVLYKLRAKSYAKQGNETSASADRRHAETMQKLK
jgi:tetratricopeptide (TPR) repeat protein